MADQLAGEEARLCEAATSAASKKKSREAKARRRSPIDCNPLFWPDPLIIAKLKANSLGQQRAGQEKSNRNRYAADDLSPPGFAALHGVHGPLSQCNELGLLELGQTRTRYDVDDAQGAEPPTIVRG